MIDKHSLITMDFTSGEDFRLKLGNLFLAIWLATVPTFISYGVFGLHGMSVCSTLESKLEQKGKGEIKQLCDDSSWETTRKYIFLIGFFITLPTWLWFYLSMKRKSKIKSTN